MKLSLLWTPLLATFALARVADKRQEFSENDDVQEWIAEVASTASVAEVFAQANSLFRLAEPLEPAQTYEIPGFHGFQISGISESILQTLQDQGLVTSYERNGQVQLEEFEEVKRQTGQIVTQQNAGYNLARISSRTAGTTGYRYRAEPGRGTFIYILDSGMNINHVDFGGRASHGANFSSDRTPLDTNGHGTSIGGLAAGTQYGVAKAASVISVKVTNGAVGTVADFLSGVEWTTNDVISRNRRGRAVANLSIVVARSDIVNNAINAMADAGIFVASAAGNANRDASTYSPGTAAGACNIGCSNSTDGASSFSNWGSAVDLFGPGDNVVSPLFSSNTGTRTTRGTSEAAPQVAGVVAYLIGLGQAQGGRGACDVLKNLATRGVLTNLRGSPNLLVYNGIA